MYEPLTAATLETIASSQSLETSYVRVTAFHAKDIFIGSPANPTGIQVDKLKILDQGIDAHVRNQSNLMGACLLADFYGGVKRSRTRMLDRSTRKDLTQDFISFCVWSGCFSGFWVKPCAPSALLSFC